MAAREPEPKIKKINLIKNKQTLTHTNNNKNNNKVVKYRFIYNLWSSKSGQGVVSGHSPNITHY